MKAPLSSILVFAATLLACSAEEPTWKPLFNGENLDDWTQKGGKANYAAEDGCIVGRTVRDGPNSFLCTERNYGDFVLEYEFKVDGRMNSGVQIRSEENEGGRVFGYQVEIDPDTERNRMWSGGIYDESRRGWIADLADNEPARKAFKPDDWNKIRVRAVGASIQTWINDVPAADLTDAKTLSGFIGLQVHWVKDKTAPPLEVRWRNIRIQDLGEHRWQPIFNGTDLDGWSTLPGGTWEVVEGAIVGKSPKVERRHGILLSKATYKDFTIRAKFRAITGNSGFYFRCEPKKGGVAVHGFQVEVDTTQATGGLYETGGRGWVVKPDGEKATAKKYKPGDWTDLELSAKGGHIVVRINGQTTAELKDDPGRSGGHIGLQLHGGQAMHVEFRDLAILTPAIK